MSYPPSLNQYGSDRQKFVDPSRLPRTQSTTKQTDVSLSLVTSAFCVSDLEAAERSVTFTPVEYALDASPVTPIDTETEGRSPTRL